MSETRNPSQKDASSTESKDLSGPYEIDVTVKGIQGRCDFSHKVGDTIHFDGNTIKGNICYTALMAILPKVYALRFGAQFPWAGDVLTSSCSGGDSRVIFEIRRTGERS